MTNEQRDTLATETHDAVIRIDAEMVAHRELVRTMATTLYGNGKIGLCSKVYLLMWILGVTSAIAVATAGTLLAQGVGKAWAG